MLTIKDRAQQYAENTSMEIEEQNKLIDAYVVGAVDQIAHDRLVIYDILKELVDNCYIYPENLCASIEIVENKLKEANQ